MQVFSTAAGLKSGQYKLKEEEWNLIFEKQLDKINRIVKIERPSAEGKQNPVNPVNPV